MYVDHACALRGQDLHSLMVDPCPCTPQEYRLDVSWKFLQNSVRYSRTFDPHILGMGGVQFGQGRGISWNLTGRKLHVLSPAWLRFLLCLRCLCHLLRALSCCGSCRGSARFLSLSSHVFKVSGGPNQQRLTCSFVWGATHRTFATCVT